jgi:hypothetical protein
MTTTQASRGRVFSDAAVTVHANVRGQRVAPPGRRLAAFACDVFLVLIPSMLLAVASAALSLALTEPESFDAVLRLFGDTREVAALAELAPVLVRVDARGLPPAVAVAVEEGDRATAGRLLVDYNLVFKIGQDSSALPPKTIELELADLVPAPFRWLSTFGVAAAYFTFFTAGRRAATPGKRLLGLRVLKIDGQPLTVWESFERFGGYFISVGTFGLGLLDLWRDPNSRVAHDRVSNTVVVVVA